MHDNFLIILIKHKTTQETITTQQKQTLIENQPCSIQNEARILKMETLNLSF